MELFFYGFAIMSVVGALGVLILPSPVYCAMSLVASFFCLGGIYIMLNQEFVGVIQVLVYAGAIMVLFLFVLMLLNQQENFTHKRKIKPQHFLAIALSLGLMAQLAGLFLSTFSTGPKDQFTIEAVTAEGSIGVIGRLLYGQYVLPLELVSILLLVAILGSVIIAKRRFPPEGKDS